MGMRRGLYRVARNGCLWFLVVMAGLFYFNLASLIRYAEQMNARHSQGVDDGGVLLMKEDNDADDPDWRGDNRRVDGHVPPLDYDASDSRGKDDSDDDQYYAGDNDDGDDKDGGGGNDRNSDNDDGGGGDGDDKDGGGGDNDDGGDIDDKDGGGNDGGGGGDNDGGGDSGNGDDKNDDEMNSDKKEAPHGREDDNERVERGGLEDNRWKRPPEAKGPPPPPAKSENENPVKTEEENLVKNEGVNLLRNEETNLIKSEEKTRGKGKKEHQGKGENVEPSEPEGDVDGAVGAALSEGIPQGPGLSFSGFHSINETLGGKPVVKVLLLTYQRAGSSFGGELLTSGGGAVYVYEPLYVWRKYLGPGASPKVESDSARVLGDLLDCRPEVVSAWERLNFAYFRRRGLGEEEDWCHGAPLRLLKTIRAREHFLHHWLSRRPDIKVVHLVRDPRGVLYSVARGGRMWSNNNRNAQLQCGYVERDMRLEDLGHDRYLRVRYEDLVERPLKETQRVMGFLGLKVTGEMLGYLQKHTGLGQHIHQKQGYMSTYRDGKFQHDHWKDRMYPRAVTLIENSCRAVMTKLDYRPFKPA